MVELIFLLGEAGSGKDTIGKEFIKKGFIRTSFADTLKEEYAKENNVDVKDLMVQGPIKEEHRKALINFAEEAKLKDPLIWLNKAFEKYIDPSTGLLSNCRLVITDFRRKYETDWISLHKDAYDIKVFYVKRDGTNDPDVLTHYCVGYTFGKGLVDATITNNGPLELIGDKINYICAQEGITTKKIAPQLKLEL